MERQRGPTVQKKKKRLHRTLGSSWMCRETRWLSQKWETHRRLTSHTEWLWMLIGLCSVRVREQRRVWKFLEWKSIFQMGFHIFSIKAFIYQHYKVYYFTNTRTSRSRHSKICCKKCIWRRQWVSFLYFFFFLLRKGYESIVNRAVATNEDTVVITSVFFFPS